MRSKQFKRFKHPLFISFVLVLCAWIFFAILFFMNTLTKIEMNVIQNNLSAMANSNAAQVRFVFQRYINTLRTTSAALNGFDSPLTPEALGYLRHVENSEGFQELSLIYPNGTIYTSHGTRKSLQQLDVLQKMTSGAPFIMDVEGDTKETPGVVTIYVPMRGENNEVFAALRCVFDTKQLSELFDETFFHAEGYYHIIDGNGKYVATGNTFVSLLTNASFFDALDKLSYEDGYSAEAIKKTFSDQQPGFSMYSYEGQQRYAYHMPVGINNWVLMMVTPREVMEVSSDQHKNNSILLTAQIAVIFTLILCYVYFTQKRAKSLALLQEQCLKALAAQTGNIIFDWDFSSNTITCLSNFKTIFGRDAVTNNSAEEALSSGMVHPDDSEAFEQVFNSVLSGHPISEVRFRIMDSDGCYRWSCLSGLVINDQRGHPFKAIGSLENIDAQVRSEEDLREKAERDILTGLYNKATTGLLIKEVLQNQCTADDLHALIIVDVDNFKTINDSFGHLFGDRVLTDLAREFRRIFRSDDIVGRIGGDEFFIFLQNVSSIAILQSKAEAICTRFRKIYTENGTSVSISASVGIAICPDHGTDFNTLYRHADEALYQVKENGKSNYATYSPHKPESP